MMLNDRGILTGAAIVLLLALVPFLPGAVDSYAFSLLFFVFIYALLAQGWNLVAGVAGQGSLGQHSVVGLGAYTTAILWSGNYIWGSLYETHPLIYYFDPVTMLLSGIAAALAAMIIGWPLLSKLRGDYFALGTLGFGEILKVLFINGGDFTGGAFGVVAPSSSFDTLKPHYWTGLGLTAGTALFIYLLMKSRIGLAFIAIRDDETAASASGVNTLLFKVLAFAGSAFIAGLAGSLYTYYIFHVGPDSIFSLDWMLLPLMMTVIGGTGTVLGPILGALVMYAVFDLAKIHIPDYHPILSGLVIILGMLFLPNGLVRMGLRKLWPQTS
jgi:branched-chain amino acid transport system permease protein